MDPTEAIVLKHLSHLGYTNVIYEPSPNETPDFLINGEIAVEVRRLNQNHSGPNGSEGLEQVSIPLWNGIKKLLPTLGPPLRGESWFVYFRFSRPVGDFKGFVPNLKKALVAFQASSLPAGGTVYRGQGIEVDLIKASTPLATYFVLGGCSDEQSGGWLLHEMGKNIELCAAEKAAKISAVRSNYGEWWLALVDHIGFGLDDFDREQFRDQVKIKHSWDKIVVISPNDPTRWFEV
jgi:hypothetical protein